jgi:hypothetical protein
MDRELKFAGSTELDNGITVSVMQDTSDNLAFGNSQIAFGNIGGMATVYVGSDSDPVDAIDDITPSAYEEANGSGSGTYNDIGDLAGEMGIGIKVAIPVLGALNAKYYPKADATKNADNAASADANNSIGSGSSISLKMNLADLPVAGSYLDGATLTGGYSEKEVSTQAVTDDQHDATVALNYALGAFSFGVQKKYHNEGQTQTNVEENFYKDTVYGVAYALNDALSISYNRYESDRHDNDTLSKWYNFLVTPSAYIQHLFPSPSFLSFCSVGLNVFPVMCLICVWIEGFVGGMWVVIYKYRGMFIVSP